MSHPCSDQRNIYSVSSTRSRHGPSGQNPSAHSTVATGQTRKKKHRPRFSHLDNKKKTRAPRIELTHVSCLVAPMPALDVGFPRSVVLLCFVVCVVIILCQHLGGSARSLCYCSTTRHFVAATSTSKVCFHDEGSASAWRSFSAPSTPVSQHRVCVQSNVGLPACSEYCAVCVGFRL